MKPQRYLAAAKWIIALGLVIGLVFLYHQWIHVNTTTVALTLVLYVLLLAAHLGLRYAVGAALLGTACYNYYFLPPIGTFTISDPQNWLALFAFLTTGVIGSRLSQQARDEAQQARGRQREVELLLLLSRELLGSDNVAELVASLPATILQVSGSTAVTLFLLEGDRLYRAGLSTEREDPQQQRQLSQALPDVETAPDGTVRIPLRAGVRPRGLLTVADLHLSAESYRAVGGLVSLAMEKAEALETVSRTEANRESERLRTLILDSITHELRTPLTAIKGAASTLLENTSVDPEIRQELLHIVDEEADRLNHLVGQAVEMAQLEAREVQMTFRPVAIEALVEEARPLCASVFASHPVTVELSSLPKVAADEDMMVKVLCNLLDNAAKYSAASTPIFLTAQVRNGYVLTSVADRGIGIDSSEQDLIFDRLYRVRHPSMSTSGTGMGLAISRAIIEAHHGKLSVTSQPGHGSVFTFSLPLAPEEDRAPLL